MKRFYIKERTNPQLKKPYYTACGQQTKRQARVMEDCLYGSNLMLSYPTEKQYKDAIESIKSDGYTVLNNF